MMLPLMNYRALSNGLMCVHVIFLSAAAPPFPIASKGPKPKNLLSKETEPLGSKLFLRVLGLPVKGFRGLGVQCVMRRFGGTSSPKMVTMASELQNSRKFDLARLTAFRSAIWGV